ncbi:PH domain-containing protein [Plantactinospora sp. KBS50]|uniref:PH domain-containing protein n=1 Tax=Plantactinospora sp. KBS50 TaxID=2024580 RepID=UPI000BAB18F0|nr:PH domain-containing protein [Plantactinospora sp. KBS50]ASW57221.1 hypothetical protein CIK06_28405 [Plantactinospora sp. KBS50]
MGPAAWRVPRAVPGLKLAGAAAVLLLALLLGGGDPVRLGVAALAAVALLAWAGPDLLAPVRLAADAAGVWVPHGYAGRRRLAWAQVERISVDRRPRFGLRTGTLEIDTGSSLHLFGRYDLGADPAEVAAVLRSVHRNATRA